MTGVFWFRFHCWGLSFLPNWGVWVINNVFTAFFFVVLRTIRRAIGDNLDVVLGPCGWWRRQHRIWRTMSTFSWCLSERYESMITDRQIHSEVHDQEKWNAVTSGDGGLIIVTAHIGHWEIGSRLPIKHGFRKVHVVREKEMDPQAQEFIRDLFSRTAGEGYEVIFADEKDPAMGALLLSALRDGDVVALQGDRPRANGQTACVQLFGKPFHLPVGPAALARAARVPLVTVFVVREGRLRSRVHVRSAIAVERSQDREGDLHRALQRVAEDVEWAIRMVPHQWFCFRNLWSTPNEPDSRR